MRCVAARAAVFLPSESGDKINLVVTNVLGFFMIQVGAEYSTVVHSIALVYILLCTVQ